MTRSWIPSFADADPDPPDSALLPETVATLTGSAEEISRTVITACKSALSGDLEPMLTFRAVVDSCYDPYDSPGIVDTIAGQRVIRYFPNPSLPILFYIHGGGWMHRMTHPAARFADELSRAVPAEVIALDYSLSPEAPPGTAIVEAYAVWEALPRGRLLFVGGGSAGGSISAGLIFTILERGARRPDGAFMIYPASELRDMYTFSVRRYWRGYAMDAEEKMGYVYLYSPDEAQQMSPKFSAVNGDVTDWPPTLVVTAQFDTLRDEGRKLAIKLLDAGNLVRYKCIEGTIHAFAFRDVCIGPRAELAEEIKKLVEVVRGDV
jgi:acetyl esterase